MKGSVGIVSWHAEDDLPI